MSKNAGVDTVDTETRGQVQERFEAQTHFEELKTQKPGGFRVDVLGGSRRTAIIARSEEVVNLDALRGDPFIRGNADFKPGVGGTITLTVVSGVLYLETCFEPDLMLLLYRHRIT